MGPLKQKKEAAEGVQVTGYGISILWLLLILCASCGKSGLTHPEEVLNKIKLEYPSILGYLRYRPERAAALSALFQGWLYRRGGESTHSFGDDFSSLGILGEIPNHCRRNSHVNVVLLDPEVFGGPMAVHFEPAEPGSLSRFLETNPEVKRLPGSDPPEYTLLRKPGAMDLFSGLTHLLGLEESGHQGPLYTYIVVEETPSGTLVLPTYEVRKDFRTFLEDTDFLRPWGEAGLVMNLELHRLARAYGEEAERLGRWVRDFFQRLKAHSGGAEPLSVALERLARYTPALMLEGLMAVEGIRWASSMPGSGLPELCLLANPGEGLDEFMSCLTEGEPDLLRLTPGALSIQWNVDPGAWSKRLGEGISFFAETVSLDPESEKKIRKRTLESMADHTGHYLNGFSWEEGRLSSVFLSALHGEASSPEAARPSRTGVVESLMDLVFPPYAFTDNGAGPSEGSKRLLASWNGDWEIPMPGLWVESDATPKLDLTAIHVGRPPPEKNLTKGVRHLPPMEVERFPGLPRQSILYIYISLLSFFNFSFPGIEKMIPTVIMGYGAVEEDRLIIRFIL
jgi:hypothetical protein